MKLSLKPVLLLSAAVLLTFVVTKTVYQRYTTREVIALMIAEDQKIESLNDVSRLENFDMLEDFLRRGCMKEAKEFIEVQKSLLLSGIAHRMKEDKTVEAEVMNRSAAVVQRAHVEALNGNPPRVVPRCA
ncbi:hypothetical protein ACPOLB_23625 [Rubrivivax sp. RP6-9]|uniref:hypothetical protein n=1 Tax=Rubrivivax sp. RP6-9 TaxID=3415750 RepID=UPI003CC6B72A